MTKKNEKAFKVIMSKDIEVESIVEKSEVQQSQELDVHKGKYLTYML